MVRKQFSPREKQRAELKGNMTKKPVGWMRQMGHGQRQIVCIKVGHGRRMGHAGYLIITPLCPIFVKPCPARLTEHSLFCLRNYALRSRLQFLPAIGPQLTHCGRAPRRGSTDKLANVNSQTLRAGPPGEPPCSFYVLGGCEGQGDTLPVGRVQVFYRAASYE